MSSWKRQIPAFFALLLVLVFTGTGWFYARRYFDTEARLRFEQEVALLRETIEFRFRGYVNLLVQTRALFLASDSVTRREFREFIAAADLHREFPGIVGIAYALKVPQGNRESFVREVSRADLAGFRIWGDPASGTSKPPYSVVTLFAEPFTEVRGAVGFDLMTESKRREAIERARDTGLPSATRPVPLIVGRHAPESVSFLLYVPVYRRGMPVRTVQERRDAFEGVITSGFLAKEVFNAILGSAPIPFRFHVHSSLEGEWASLLFSNEGEQEREHNPFTLEFPIEFAGVSWRVDITPLPGLKQQSSRWIPRLILALGLSAAFVLFRMLWLSRLRTEAEAQARDATESARERMEFLYRATSEMHASSLDPHRILDRLSHTLIPRLADWAGAIRLAGSGEAVKVALHSAYGRSDLAREFMDSFPIVLDPKNGFGNVLLTGEPLLIKDFQAQDIGRFVSDGVSMALARKAGVISILCVPVLARGKILGAIVAAMSESGRHFTEADLHLVSELASRAGSAMDNAELYREAQEAVRVRDEFISIASHELKTPLTTLKLQSQLAQRMLRGETELKGPTDRSRLGKMADISEKQINRLNRLVDDMLDVSRIRSGQLSLQVERIDLGSVVRENVDRLAAQIAESGSKIELLAPSPVPGDWDRYRIDQVFVNLLTNALKYGEGRPIFVRVSSEGSKAILAVQDQGVGIPVEDHERVFKRFERASPWTKFSGLGLGLYIVRQIVEVHGGRVRLESAPEQGSTFIVELPLPHSSSSGPIG